LVESAPGLRPSRVAVRNPLEGVGKGVQFADDGIAHVVEMQSRRLSGST
jgi:hypothetical protein